MRYFSGLQKQAYPFLTVLGSLPELHFLQVLHSNSSLASEMVLFWTLNKLDTTTKTNCMKTYFNFFLTKLCQKRKLNHDTTNQVATFISQKVRKISLQLLFTEWYGLWRIRLGHCRWVLTFDVNLLARINISSCSLYITFHSYFLSSLLSQKFWHVDISEIHSTIIPYYYQ